METRLMFLIVAILGLYIVFSEKGQLLLKKFVGVNITNVNSK